MDKMQMYALAHPLARAGGLSAEPFRILRLPWSIILTVNK
jgi:hypothetical protein